jgi:hypothetical protein
MRGGRLTGCGTARGCAALALAVLLGVAPAHAAMPSTRPHFIKHDVQGDGKPPSDAFYDYDGHGPTEKHPNTPRTWVKNPDPHNRSEPGWKDRDWPITMIWWGEASKAKIKSGLQFGDRTDPNTVFSLDRNGREEYLPYRQKSIGDTKVRWNPAKGIKTPCNDYHRDTHIRYYGVGEAAPTSGSQRFWDPADWGYFVVASTHFDRAEEKEADKETVGGVHNKCFWKDANGHRLDRWFGRSEEASRFVEAVARANSGGPFSGKPFGNPVRDAQPIGNTEGKQKTDGSLPQMRVDENNEKWGYRGENNHYWQSDGWATTIQVYK